MRTEKIKKLDVRPLLNIISICLTFALFSCNQNSEKSEKIIVGISQIVEHSALDQEREGMLEVLQNAEGLNEKIKIVYENAQGNLATASQIASKLISLKPKVIVAISTPSAQSLKALCAQHKIPLVFTAVSYPEGAKLIAPQYTETSKTVGISDFLPSKEQLKFIQKVLPNTKRLGIIYNPGETNSVKAIENIEKEGKQLDLNVVLSTANKMSEISTACQNLMGKVDVIYIPNDNTAVAAIGTIVKIAHENKVPVFAGDIGSVKNGAVATLGYDRKTLGRKAGEIVLNILQDKPQSYNIAYDQHATEIFINEKSMQKLGLNLPAELLMKAKKI